MYKIQKPIKQNVIKEQIKAWRFILVECINTTGFDLKIYHRAIYQRVRTNISSNTLLHLRLLFFIYIFIIYLFFNNMFDTCNAFRLG